MNKIVFSALYFVAGSAASVAAPAVNVLSPVPALPAPLDPIKCDNRPVIMVVSGVIHDRARMAIYAKAIRDSGLYPHLGGYYVNNPSSIATFEGTPPENATTLIVRFPCLAHARSFWYSQIYQEKIIPERLNPVAGTFSVTVYEENALPPYMVGRVTPGKYAGNQAEAIVTGIEKVPAFSGAIKK
jgi:uncharacterized protein (DUF1330 family)